MDGDYHRYGAEIASGAEQEAFRDKAMKAYTAAEKAAQELDKTNPIRLGLALNFSVFYHETCGKKDDAMKKAKQAFEEAFKAWRKVLDDSDVLRKDAMTREDIIEIIDTYSELLEQLDEPFPQPFILDDVLNRT